MTIISIKNVTYLPLFIFFFSSFLSMQLLVLISFFPLISISRKIIMVYVAGMIRVQFVLQGLWLRFSLSFHWCFIVVFVVVTCDMLMLLDFLYSQSFNMMYNFDRHLCLFNTDQQKITKLYALGYGLKLSMTKTKFEWYFDC